MTWNEDALMEIAILRAQLVEAEREREEARQDAAFQCLRAADKDCVIARIEAERDAHSQSASHWLGKAHEQQKRAWKTEADLAAARDRLKFLCDAVGRMDDDLSEELYRRVAEARAFLERTGGDDG